jgi:hypothetical protein
MWVMSGSDSMLRQGKESVTGRWRGREILSPIGTTRQIDYVPHPQAIGDFPQLGAGGRKDAAEQSALVELLHPILPGLGAASQPPEDPGQRSARARNRAFVFPGYLIERARRTRRLEFGGKAGSVKKRNRRVGWSLGLRA